MKQLVRLRTRPSRDGRAFKYILDYLDENGKRCRPSLGHADRRKAERQRAQKESELRMGIVAPQSMKLSDFLKDSLSRTGSQIRESTQQEHRFAMKHFVKVIGNIDYQSVRLKHGELFRQACLDQGNSPATVSKKLRALKRLFQLAVERKQLEENPLKYIKLPKWTPRKIETFDVNECERLIKAARDCQTEISVQWDMLIIIALTTGMRRGELLNAVWTDVDFDGNTLDVSPKKNTAKTWEWQIKDCERRTLPLDEHILSLLAERQSKQPEGYPYVFVPDHRYDSIQKLRQKGRWSSSDSRLKVINNFRCKFSRIQKRANIRVRRFHDLRATTLTNWLANGMSEYEVMRLAGHSNFETTHKFYLAVSSDLVDKAREVGRRNLGHIWHAPSFLSKKV